MFGEPVAAAVPAAAPVSAPVPVAAPVAPAQPYRVLARKYRPQTFSALIGQEAMVQTLANAIRRDRLAHAFLMTGVRGVGKTSTARLIAKALNCIGPDGQGGPTIDPCGQCEPCRAIAEGRHIDVIEMDAASHTGVDDVREIIEAVRYAAVSARYKIYIIDEVHMLAQCVQRLAQDARRAAGACEVPVRHHRGRQAAGHRAFALPAFRFAAHPTALLADHFAHVCKEEGVEAEDEALAMVAAAAEGSARDGLSILDQAISHADLAGSGEGEAIRVTAEQVRTCSALPTRRCSAACSPPCWRRWPRAAGGSGAPVCAGDRAGGDDARAARSGAQGHRHPDQRPGRTGPLAEESAALRRLGGRLWRGPVASPVAIAAQGP
jgi:DNA polymerase-3 subunit gamma/tau